LGLDAAHRAQVVHRDLKPNNVFRDERERGAPLWKILDFGVSRALGDASITAAELVGTPQYMSPEQVRGERALDPRSDIYALTAIAYRALTGKPPFEGELPGVLRSIVERMPAAPSAAVRVPRDLDAVIAIGLAKQPEQRFDSARELARAFLLAVRGELPEALRSRARALLARQPYAA
jgi:serine/threonine-protein kinase